MPDLVPSWNRIAGTLDSVVTVMARCLTVSVPRRNLITLDRFTVIVGCLTLSVPSGNKIAVILDRVFMVVTSYLTLRVPRRNMLTLDRINVMMASCLTLFPVGTE